MNDAKLYSIEQVKEAFWKSFHKCGEVWFDYLEDEEQSEISTNEEWKDFSDNLIGKG